MSNSDISFLEKIILQKKLTAYLSSKLKENEIPDAEFQLLLHNLERWGVDLKKRAMYYDL
tara:strand:+ start:505 stop:684 length:180 start_codon:yes stop_codon:yes gene_type:complete